MTQQTAPEILCHLRHSAALTGYRKPPGTSREAAVGGVWAFPGTGRTVTPPDRKEPPLSQIRWFFLRNLAISAVENTNPPAVQESPTDLGKHPSLRRRGKQSVWLSACRNPDPNGEHRAEARTHFEPVMNQDLSQGYIAGLFSLKN